jgi:Uma2 family endonuclease
MSAVTHTPASSSVPPLPTPLLYNGDRLSRDEFERRYAAMPHVNKAELIEGVVHMPSPVSADHSRPHAHLLGWLAFYTWSTPGVETYDNSTVRLDMDNEPQPDAALGILESHGGQSRLDASRYIAGAPELVAEIAVSSASIDLHAKLNVYRRNGVREYVVWRVEDRAIDGFILRGSSFERLAPGADGDFRSEHLPGLWLDGPAMLSADYPSMSRVAQAGLASPEHTAFVEKLRRAAAPRTPT